MDENEIIKAAFKRAVRTVKRRPARGQRTYRNVSRVKTGLLCHVEEGNDRLVVDGIKAFGGSAAGPSPITLLRSALSSCIAMGIKQWAAYCEVKVDEIEVAVETDIDARGQLGVSTEAAVGFEAVRVAVNITSPAPQKTVDEVVNLAIKHSPLMEVFNLPLQIDQRISTVSATAA